MRSGMPAGSCCILTERWRPPTIPERIAGRRACDGSPLARSPKILRLELDRRAVRRALGGVVPGVAIACERRAVSHTLRCHQPLERVEPMPVISLAGVRVA